jgi:hypothetical protein
MVWDFGEERRPWEFIILVFGMQREVGVMKKSNIITMDIYIHYYTTY